MNLLKSVKKERAVNILQLNRIRVTKRIDVFDQHGTLSRAVALP